MKKFAILFVCLLLISCGKDDEPVPTCGCDSPTIYTSNDQTGVLRKNSGNFKNTSIASSYYIVVGNESLSGYLSICNINMLTSIKVSENTAVDIVFSGELKEMCDEPSTFNDYYQDIKLTKIQ